MITTIAETLHTLYEGFDFAESGEDHALTRWLPETYATQADYHAQIADMRAVIGETSYDGLLMAANYKALAEADPNLKVDALLELAATALSFAASVQRQTDAFNAVEEKPVKARKGAE